MPTELSSAAPAAQRTATARRLLMYPPTYVEVSCSINPWMQPHVPVDLERAQSQWAALRATYERLGHQVQIVDPVPGLPDMVFAANAGVARGDRALVSRFTHPERQGETEAFRVWFEQAGFGTVGVAGERNEGAGDVLAVGGVLLAGSGLRTTGPAHAELEAFFDVPVVTLELVDPRFYHLDTALTVLDDATIVFFPAAFSTASVARIDELFPAAIRVAEEDACAFGLDAMSDGRNVVLSDAAVGLHAQRRAAGFDPVGVDIGELMKAGDGATCCTLELHP